MDSILITGAAGFVGQHLVERCLADGHRVHAIDNFSVGQRQTLERFDENARFRLWEGDVRDGSFVSYVMREASPSTVYHLAAIHFIPLCESDPKQTLDVNVTGTQVVLATLPSATTRFVLASTGDVYAPSDAPHREDDPVGSLNIYGVSKQFCEQLLRLAGRRRPETRFIASRFFNIYGPGETNPHVLPDIMAGIRRGGALRLGNLTPKRDYIFVLDIVDALVRLRDYSGSAEALNIGSGVPTSVEDLLATLREILGAPLIVERDPARIRPVERQSLVADVSRTARELAWRARTSLRQGLDATLEDELPEQHRHPQPA